MANEEYVPFTDSEKELIEIVAKEKGCTFDAAVAALASEGLAKKVRAKARHRPGSSVLEFGRKS